MLPLSAQLKDFWFRRLASLQNQKFISKTVATVDNLCMVDHVKFVMHFKDFMACCNIIIGEIDGWVPSQNIGARAGGPQDWCTTNPRMSQRSTDTSDRIHYSLLQYSATMSAVSVIVFHSLTVAAIRGPRLKLLLWIFLRDKIYTEFFPTTSQRRWHAQNFGRMSFGGPFTAGGPYARAYRA